MNELMLYITLFGFLLHALLWLWRSFDKNPSSRPGYLELAIMLLSTIFLIFVSSKLIADWIIIAPIAAWQASLIIRLVGLFKKGQALDAEPIANLPSITYAIPARNEDVALKNALTKALAVEYDTIDYLALDDCSFDQTPNVIRSFAHEGVRFVQSTDADSDSLEQSLAVLVDQGLGDYVVFSGVDVELEPTALKRAMSYMVANNLDMLSIIPAKKPGDNLEYAFEPPRYLMQALTSHRGAYAHSLWIASREYLQRHMNDNGDDKRIQYDRLASQTNAFELVLPRQSSGFWVRKRTKSQWRSALRDGSLTQGADIGIWFSLSVSMLVLLASDSTWVAAGVLLLWVAMHLIWSIRARRSYAAYWALNMLIQGASILPVVVLSSIMRRLGVLSWKGRNVCYPPKLYRDEFKIKN